MGDLYIYTGDGAGKTTAALGLCMRALGHGKRVIVAQFMKGRKTGEWMMQEKIPNLKVHLLGKKGWVDLKSPSKKDKKLAQDGFESVMDGCLKKKPFILVLDEMNLAAAIGLIKPKYVLEKVDKLKKTNIVITGRRAPKEFLQNADYVTVIENRKRPKEIKARKGIEF